MMLIPTAVFIVFTLSVLAIGLVAGYATGSAGPCPDCDAIEEQTSARLIHESYDRATGARRG